VRTLTLKKFLSLPSHHTHTHTQSQINPYTIYLFYYFLSLLGRVQFFFIRQPGSGKSFFCPGPSARAEFFFDPGCAGPARLVNFFSSSCGLAPGRKKSLYYMLFFSVRPWYQARANFFLSGAAQILAWRRKKLCLYYKLFFLLAPGARDPSKFFFCSGAAAPRNFLSLDSCTGILGKFRDM